jgi:hypothetical protein
MTPFRNDEQNPFSRESVWPKMPQTPLSVAPGRPAPSRYAPPQDVEIDQVMAPAAPAEPDPFRALTRTRHARPPRRLRRTPLIAAAAVGVGGLLTLFLLIGTGPRP